MTCPQPHRAVSSGAGETNDYKLKKWEEEMFYDLHLNKPPSYREKPFDINIVEARGGMWQEEELRALS